MHIPIRRNLHKFLAFSIDSRLSFFKAMPFGLNVAPQAFTRVLHWPLRLHEEGINVLAYLDDWFVHASTLAGAHQAVQTTLRVLTSLGFLINYEKSSLTPKDDLVWLGVRWLPKEGRWALPQEKL